MIIHTSKVHINKSDTYEKVVEKAVTQLDMKGDNFVLQYKAKKRHQRIEVTTAQLHYNSTVM